MGVDSFIITSLVLYYLSIRRLHKFEKQIVNTYSNIENKTTFALKMLILMLTVTAIAIFLVNMFPLGEHQEWMLYAVWIICGILLFQVFNVFGTHTFTANEMKKELAPYTQEAGMEDSESEEDIIIKRNEIIEKKLSILIHEQHVYLQRNLKIVDLAKLTGTNRTYLSRYINQVKGKTFNDYINYFRIQHAKRLLAENPNLSRTDIAEQSGYASVKTFILNYQKYQEE